MPIRRSALIAALLSTLAAPAHAQGQPPEDVLQAGFMALEDGDGARAAATFRRVLATHPRDPIALYGAGAAAFLEGRTGEALQHLRKAVDVEPRLVEASELLGEIAYREGDLDLAIKTYEAALKHQPSNVTLRQRLASWRSEADVHNPMVTYTDDRFSVMFDGPANATLAARATSVLRDAFWRIGGGLRAYPSIAINVILYSEKQFRDVTRAPEWAAGGYDGQIRIPVRGAAQNLKQFDRVLIHELTHAMLEDIAPRNVPTWLNEGLAMYFDGDAAGSEKELASVHVFVPLAALDGGFTHLSAAQAAIAYEVSGFAAHALVTRIGLANVGTLLQELATGSPLDRALLRFGVTLSEFEATLAKRVGARLR